MRTVARAVALLLVAGLCVGCSRTSEGVAAWREGRHEDAHRAFAVAADAAGDGASVELLHDRALAALRLGRLAEAESAADAAAARGGASFEALRDFVRGNAAFARCELASRQAGTVEAEPFALEVAIAHAEGARKAWAAAASSREDWPEARRNVERALLKIEELKQRRAGAEQKRRKTGTPEFRPVPIPPPPKRPEKPPEAAGDGRGTAPPKKPSEEAPTEAQTTELAPAEVARLFEILAAREKEKAALRRARREARSSEVERDW